MQRLYIIIIIPLILFSCKESGLEEYYNQPANSSLSIYDGLKELKSYDLFLEAVDSIEQTKSLDYSLMTVLAPNDEKFQAYLSRNGYNTIGDIPKDTLKELINFHIIEWPYAENDIRSNPKYFKRQTRMQKEGEFEYIGTVERYISNDNKYASFFTEEMFEAYDGTTDDYNLLTGREFEGFHVYDARIDSSVPFGNGWVHYVDKILEPVQNVDYLLYHNDDYSLFKNLFHRFNAYEDGSYKDGKTYYKKRNYVFGTNHYLQIDFFIDFEGIGGTTAQNKRIATPLGSSGFSMVVPKNEPLQAFLDEYFSDYSEFDSLVTTGNPDNFGHIDNIIKQIIKPSLFKEQLVLPAAFDAGKVFNSEGSVVSLDVYDPDVDITLCSNGIVYGIDYYEVPRTFKSVLRPLFTQSDYTFFAMAVLLSRIDVVLSDPETEYTVLVPTDEAFIKNGISIEEKEFVIYDEEQNTNIYMDRNDILAIVYSHLIPKKIIPSAQVQFVESFGGNFVGLIDSAVWSGGNLETRWDSIEITGNAIDPILPGIVQTFEAPYVDNGLVYIVDEIVKSSEDEIGQIISLNPEYQKFEELCINAGLLVNNRFSFIVSPKKYTAFIPTNAAIDKYIQDGLLPADIEGLTAFIKYHFVLGEIFTDGIETGTFQTAMVDEYLSNEYSTVYTSIEVLNSPGNLKIKGPGNSSHLNVIDSEESNVICADGVIHQIDGVLDY